MQKIPKNSSQSNPQQRQEQISFSANKNKIIINQLPNRQQPPTDPQPRNYQLTFQKNKQSPYQIVNAKKQQPQRMQKIQEQKPFNIYKKGLPQKIESKDKLQKTKKTNLSSSSSQNEQDDSEEISITEQQMKPQDMKTKRISLLIKRQETKQFIELDCLLPDVYQSQILLSRNGQDYTPNRANICGLEDLKFTNFTINIMGIKKIKIYPTVAKKKSFKIKISHIKEEFNFGVQLRKQLNYLPEHYIWFAKIINARLVQNGIKLQCKNKNTNLYNEKVIFNQGYIYKCSKYRKKWQKRYVLINNEGLFSFKNPKENYTMSIPSANIEQLWTYFDLYGQHLIIKLMHKTEKTEFAIPILDFCLKQDHSNWLFSFYRLLMEHKIHIKI